MTATSTVMRAEGSNRVDANASQTGISGIGVSGANAYAEDPTTTEAYVGNAIVNSAVNADAVLNSNVTASVDALHFSLLGSGGTTHADVVSTPTVLADVRNGGHVDGGSGDVIVHRDRDRAGHRDRAAASARASASRAGSPTRTRR